MESKKVAGTLLTMVFRVCIMVLVVVFTILLAGKAYAFGISIFHEHSMTEMTGDAEVTVTVTIPADASNMDVAEIMEENGLTNNKWLFFAQIELSDHSVSSAVEPILPGTYELTTKMTPTEIMELMSTVTEEETDEETE